MARSYLRMTGDRFELIKLLTTSVAPLGILTVIVLAVILFGITTATESAAVGAAGAFILAFHARTLDWKRTKEAVFLTAKTTAMVCWLFVGSAIFSAVFAILGGQALIEKWVLALNLSPIQFMIVSQAIIFLLGWPLEWTEIIIIFVPIFLPLLEALQHRPDPVGRAGVREPAGGVPLAAGRDVGVLSQGRRAEARHAEPDLRRHDALHADRDRLHGLHVPVARPDAVAAELSVRRLRRRPPKSIHQRIEAAPQPRLFGDTPDRKQRARDVRRG